MMQLPHKTTTNTHRIIEATQVGNRIQVAVYGAKMMTGVDLYWPPTIEAAEVMFEELVAMNTRKPHTPQRVAFTAPYVDEATEPDTMVAQVEPLSAEAEAAVFPSTLTLSEARAIAKFKGYGGNVADSLYRMALRTLSAAKPVVTYAPVDNDEDDLAFDIENNERAESLMRDEDKANGWINGDF